MDQKEAEAEAEAEDDDDGSGGAEASSAIFSAPNDRPQTVDECATRVCAQYQSSPSSAHTFRESS